MLSLLNSPYPTPYGRKGNFYEALCIGLFVALFLMIFQPFGISESKESNLFLKTGGFGVVSFVVLLFFFYIFPRFFKTFFLEKNYTLGKELIANVGMLFFVTIGNGLYAQYILQQDVFGSIFVLIWQTLLVGIFPLTFVALIQYNRKLNANIRASKEIQIPNQNSSSLEIKTSSIQYFFISGEQEKKQIELDDLLYLESDGNYASLHQLKEGQVLKTIHRTTLKSIEEENTFENIQRCHRSYIVNLNQVTAVNGNAQGLKLSLKNCDDIIPVSKKYIPEIKNYFSKA